MTTTPTPACVALRFLASAGPALVPSRICCVAVVLRAAAAHEPGSPPAAPAPELGHVVDAAFPCLAAEMADAASHPLLAAGTGR